MRQRKNTFQTAKQDKFPEEELSEVEISNLPDNKFEVMIRKVLKILGRRMDEQSEKFLTKS